MKTFAIRLSLGIIIAAAVLGALATSPPSFFSQTSPPKVSRITPEQLQWVDEPDGLGFKQAIVEGDPKKAGIYIVQVKFPPGVMSRPHFHGETRYATVIKGTWYTGEGDEFAPDKTVPLKPGSFMKHPAGAHHFDGAKNEEVIVELMGMGPSSTTRIRPDLGLFDHSVKK
jgi:uncharacterized RmlC-like cupin family protein